MSSNEFSSRDKFQPRPLDQIDSQASFSKENTEKSMQGSFYDCDITSLNTLGLSSPRSRTRRNESISSKSKISSRNMLEFEEFILENPAAELSKRGYLLDTVINNTLDNIVQEKDRERTFDSHNKTLPTEILNDDYLLGSDILPTIRKDEAKNDGLAPLFPIMAGLDTPTVHETVETGGDHQKNMNAAVQQSTNEDSKLNTTEGGYRFGGVDVLSDYTESFDDSHLSGKRKKEENPNTKKLEEYVSSQDVQIKTMLKSCNALRAENDFLRKSLSIAKNTHHNEQRFDYKNKENCKDLERVVAMKGMNFYMQELEYKTEIFRKELQNRNRIIQELQKELDLKDYEIETYKKKREHERLTQSINVPDSTRLPKTSMADHRQCKSTHRDSSMEFQTPNRPQLRENKFNNLEEQNELVKVFTASRGVSDQVSPSDMKYIQHMADISEKLDEIKRKEKQVSKKESKKRQEKSETSKQYQSEYGTVNAYMGYTGSSQLIKYRTNPNLINNNDKSTKNRDFSPYASASASEHNKISRQGGSTFEEGSLEEGRISSSLAEAIFDHSGVKDISRRDIEEFSPFNMSPAKGKIYMGGKEERHNKKTSSNAASQNVSRVNEMSMINETLSENYVTESIHNRLAYELQKQLGASSKFKNKELKNFGKAPREDFMGKTYEGIEKVHQTIQNQKRKISSSTPNSRADTVEKGLKDSITHKETPATIHYESSSSKWKDNYYTSSANNLPSKSENASLNILKTSNLNIIKPSTINTHDLKPQKTPSNYDKSGNNEPYTKIYAKGSEKKTRSATTSQDKIMRKSKEKYDHKYMGKTIEGPFGYSHPSNETMLSINSSVDRMFDKNSHFRSHHSLEREQKFMQTQPYHRNEIINEVDDLSPLPTRSESHHHNNKHSKLSTAPLSSYLKLARSGKNLESSSAAISKKTNNNISDLENKENRLDSNPRPNTTSTTKGSKRTLFSTESNTEMRNNYASNLDKLTTIPGRAGLDSSKGSGTAVVQKKSAGSASQARHQTPTTKVYLDAPSQGTSSKAQSKSVKTKDKDLDEVNLSALENSRLNNSRARSSSNKNSSKSGMRNMQGFNNYPVYNNLMMNNGSVGEYGHSSQGSKGGKAVLHHSSLEHRSYDATYQNEREMMKKNKEDYLESSAGSRDTYTGQFLAKNRRESYKPYNLYSYDSKKY